MQMMSKKQLLLLLPLLCASVAAAAAAAKFSTARATPGGVGAAAVDLTGRASLMQVLLAAGSTADEVFAAQELSQLLGQAVGAPVPIVSAGRAGVATTIAVGYNAATGVGLPAAMLTSGLGAEGYVLSSNATGLQSGCIAVSGGQGARRGAISPWRDCHSAQYTPLRTFIRCFKCKMTVSPTARRDLRGFRAAADLRVQILR